ncbi:hypothetical protein [Iodobacter ciconiae]|uniref:Uncharacterized protein n=1 Tax=Iodobacter ciconiae TaxID=2496266 RepID=A0A3S8ZWF2_9NEIS|nr:hypothetical protein [Iodobacter ciconiae]AZN37827.1 hypothetical protein EJO50_15955 [Iodobacter ciconiae]
MNLGFIQYSNTTVFYKDGLSLISPAVAKNKSGGYWFDLRKVNLDRLSSSAFLFVRIVPDFFVLEPLNQVDTLVATALMGNRPHSGDVWAIGIELELAEMAAHLFNKSASQIKLKCKLLSLDETKIGLNLLGKSL